ncbi:tetrathionate reductase family octaheme c-type cytochrome [Zavarzinia compransoris]|uniref:tetrathionate reductase family octaheme c-type cytochrome n=1 Tax=Zavarzinia marina TaxID=2911065 RepID=UPI001F31F041|nr:tetrathionate reductase family octaheme c-type cytochrome [Zavarzinia marina]MCF4164891.1 tetrathionate reductase family octaheme c-type cytochrome [Zavarzinia marina]
MRRAMTKRLGFFMGVLLLGSFPALAQPADGTTAAPGTSTADHSLFEILQQDFKSGPEVTAACLTCHTEAADHVMDSIHYTWEFPHPTTGQLLGKRHVINAFCGNVVGNEPRCTSCHAGYGWTDMHRPPPRQSTAVDCLVCHDRSGAYAKLSTGAGHPPMSTRGETITGAPAKPVDLRTAALGVGLPGRDNCGQCHFYGGGGDNVKHGDLSSVLVEPTRAVDVHMDADGLNFACSVCHVTRSHKWAGSRYAMRASDPEGTGLPGQRRDVATCESCHGAAPHPADLTPSGLIGVKMNDHAGTVACQTCHIPTFARGGVATKMKWDWSTAGRLEDGKPISTEDYTQGDGQHRHTYLSTKGDFEWGEDVVPHYAWFDGQMIFTTGDQTIDPAQVVEVNSFEGARDDGVSRIWPFKRMDGRQSYDAGYSKLAYSHVWGPTTDTAYWTNFDWGKAIEAGMKAAGMPYSGEYGFVDTHYYWPITHMVAPAEAALACDACHAEGGRLDGLPGVYVPGTRPLGLPVVLGLLLFAGTLAGVMLHVALRLLTGRAHHD